MLSKSDSWKMFDQISSTYDRVNWILSFGQDQRWRRKAASYLPLRPHLEVLDLATGTGDQLTAILKSGFSIQRLIGIDLSEKMLELGRKKFTQPFVELLRGDAQKLSFSPNQFDAITFSFGIRNVENPLLSLQEIKRVLKPGGKALILEFSIPPVIIRPFFLFYLRHVLPFLGGLFSKNKGAYQYLNSTIETFPSGKDFLALMHSAGFESLQRHPMNFGAVTLYVGEKR
jgi:demethylmenaquinone methyltransferase/2-methoxy-6-polyprenyl-1,4-benzoquinol methylase